MIYHFVHNYIDGTAQGRIQGFYWVSVTPPEYSQNALFFKISRGHALRAPYYRMVDL